MILRRIFWYHRNNIEKSFMIQSFIQVLYTFEYKKVTKQNAFTEKIDNYNDDYTLHSMKFIYHLE